MKRDLQSLFAAVRRTCPQPLWNQGTSLARDGQVSLESEDEDEILVRVSPPQKPGAIAVRVYPNDDEWDCDCPSRAPACEHVAAAVIALSQQDRGAPLARASDKGRVIYEFTRCAPLLSLERFIEQKQDRKLFRGDKTALFELAKSGILITQADRRAAALLDPQRRGALPEDLLRALFHVLGDAPTFLEGDRVRLHPKAVLPRASVRNHPKGDGFILRVLADPAVDEVVGAGLVRCADRLHFLGELTLSGIHMERLPMAKHFRGNAVATLVQKTIPALQKRILVHIETESLPGQTRTLKPQIRFCVQRSGDTLDILAQIVYGDPPVAKVVDKKLVRLGKTLPKRDEAAEVQARMQLRDQYLMVPEQRVYLHGAQAASFLDKLSEFKGPIEGLDPRTSAKVELVPHLSADAGPLRLSFYLPGQHPGKHPPVLDAAGVLAAFARGQTQILVPEQGAARLPLSFLAAHATTLSELLTGPGGQGPAPKDLSPQKALQLAMAYQALNRPAPAALDKVRTLLQDFSGIPGAKLPADFKATLRPYQQAGVNWLRFLFSLGMGALLADDMGLGKTVQTLGALCDRSLVVCPTSVIHNWKSQAQRFVPETTLCVYHGKSRTLDPAAKLTITSYALMRQDPALQETAWDLVVLDEAQAIKNPASQTSQAAYTLQAKARLALSGTPVENRLDELWSIMHFCNPGLLGGRKAFAASLAEPIAAGQQGAMARLSAKLRPVTLRRKKDEVAKDLPPRTEDILYCELSEQERDHYNRILAQTQRELSQDLQSQDAQPFSLLERLLRLRQAACHSGLLPGVSAKSSSKIERLTQTLCELVQNGHRALVFSQWTSMLDAVQPALLAQDLSFSRIDGQTRDRAQVVQTFASPKGPSIMLISLKAGGTGLNLTAADHVFLLDPWWNPAAEAQAADRAHRIGQDKPVFVYRMVAKDTVEEKILALQAQKRALADTALASAGASGSLSSSELRGLLTQD